MLKVKHLFTAVHSGLSPNTLFLCSVGVLVYLCLCNCVWSGGREELKILKGTNHRQGPVVDLFPCPAYCEYWPVPLSCILWVLTRSLVLHTVRTDMFSCPANCEYWQVLTCSPFPCPAYCEYWPVLTCSIVPLTVSTDLFHCPTYCEYWPVLTCTDLFHCPTYCE